MVCPLCQSSLSSVEIETIDGQSASIDECLNCGGHFLPPFLVNFISQNTAKNVDSVLSKATSLHSSSILCPHCQQEMSSIKDDSVPNNVTVFKCPNNHGDFYPLGQLLQFKKAQDAKINYHKLWGIPLKSAFAVIIPLLIVFTAITVIPNVITQMKYSQESRVKATDILTQPLTTKISNTQVLISFSTKTPAKTKITFTKGFTQTFTVSTENDTNHLLSVENLSPQTTYNYFITLDQDGKITTTSEYTFTTP